MPAGWKVLCVEERTKEGSAKHNKIDAHVSENYFMRETIKRKSLRNFTVLLLGVGRGKERVTRPLGFKV